MATITGLEGPNLGPLTTGWTPPSSCLDFYLFGQSPTHTVGFMGQKCEANEPVQTVQDNTDCWPPVLANVAEPTFPFYGWGFYSPGIQCPTGYTSACTAEYQKRGDWPVQFSLFSGETAIGCCPRYTAGSSARDDMVITLSPA